MTEIMEELKKIGAEVERLNFERWKISTALVKLHGGRYYIDFLNGEFGSPGSLTISYRDIETLKKAKDILSYANHRTEGCET